jgi:hypothetical protein
MSDKTLTNLTVALLLALAATFAVTDAFAHDPAHPELDRWFMSLHSKHGPCCDGSDAMHLREVDWETQNKEHSHYRVKIPKDEPSFEAAMKGAEVETVWADVDDDAVLDEPNKDGSTLVWPMYHGFLGTGVRCFMPGTMS